MSRDEFSLEDGIRVSVERVRATNAKETDNARHNYLINLKQWELKIIKRNHTFVAFWVF